MARRQRKNAQRAAVGAKMRRAREKLGLSQQEMADKLEVSQAVISSWEQGDYGPDPLRMRGVAQGYQLDVVDLIPRAAA